MSSETNIADASDWRILILVSTTDVKEADSKLLDDQIKSFNYGQEDQIRELSETLQQLNPKELRAEAITLTSLPKLMQSFSEKDKKEYLVLNLCDGTERDGFPGRSVVAQLANEGMAFSGARLDFYDISTSKLAMKRLFDEYRVPSAPWGIISFTRDAEGEVVLEESSKEKLESLPWPLLIKPDDSYESCGITEACVVWNVQDLAKHAQTLVGTFPRIFAETFIKGREFTCLVTGDGEIGLTSYPAAERKFSQKLPWYKRFVSFELFWEIERSETDEWEYAFVEDHLQAEVQRVAKLAYNAVRGSGYARVDMRYDDSTGRLYVLEVNANCGMSGHPETVLGMMIHKAGHSYGSFLLELLQYARCRRDRQVSLEAARPRAQFPEEDQKENSDDSPIVSKIIQPVNASDSDSDSEGQLTEVGSPLISGSSDIVESSISEDRVGSAPTYEVFGRKLKVCLLESAYDNSSSPFAQWDPPCDVSHLIPEHEVNHHFIVRDKAVEQVRRLCSEGYDVFINLCDGNWDEDRAGYEVVMALERTHQAFTGANSSFYFVSRETLKLASAKANVGTPCFHFAFKPTDVDDMLETLTFPLLVKHFDGYGSVGLVRENLVYDESGLRSRVAHMIETYGGALVEEFIDGREFTVLVSEDPDCIPQKTGMETPYGRFFGIRSFQPVEFVFPKGEQFKHFNLKWEEEIKADQTWVPVKDTDLATRLRSAAEEVFREAGGQGYARADIRMDSSGEIYVIDLNPNCGVFYPPSYASPGSADMILNSDPITPRGFLLLCIKLAIARRAKTLAVMNPKTLNEVYRTQRTARQASKPQGVFDSAEKGKGGIARHETCVSSITAT